MLPKKKFLTWTMWSRQKVRDMENSNNVFEKEKTILWTAKAAADTGTEWTLVCINSLNHNCLC